MLFEDFVQHCSARLFRTALLLTGQDRSAAEDLLQVVLERVVLSITDPAEAGALESAARKRDHSLDTFAIRVVRARYSLVHLQNAADALSSASMARRLPFRVNTVGYCAINTWPICGGLPVMVTNPATAERLAARRLATLGGRTIQQFLGVQLTFKQTGPGGPVIRVSPAGG